jgi:cell division protease FtsH
MGGRVAEELVLNIKTTGAGNDIERASEMARRMVCEYGMSDELGPLTFGKKEEQIFLGREISQHRDYSEATAQRIDNEVSRIVTGSYDKCTQLISDNMDRLHDLAKGLLEKETLDARDIDEIMAGNGAQPAEQPVAEEADQPPEDA